MQAVIMAGGKGTRLMPLTKEDPKPMVKLLDKPVMEYVIQLLKKHEVTDIAVTLGYLPGKIIDYFGDGKKWGVKLTYFIENDPLGTAGGVKNCEKYLYDEDFFVLSADGYAETDLTKAMQYHVRMDSLFTLVCQKRDYPEGLGVLERDESGIVTAFLEKPIGIKSALVNTGIYVLNRKVLDLIPEGFYDFGKQLLPSLTGQAYAYRDDSYWSDIGTLESYYETNKKLAKELVFA